MRILDTPSERKTAEYVVLILKVQEEEGMLQTGSLTLWNQIMKSYKKLHLIIIVYSV